MSYRDGTRYARAIGGLQRPRRLLSSGASVGPAEPVGVDAAVAEPPAVVLDEPADGPFQHRSVLPVGVVEGVGAGLGAPCGEEVVVGVQLDALPGVAGRSGGGLIPASCPGPRGGGGTRRSRARSRRAPWALLVPPRSDLGRRLRRRTRPGPTSHAVTTPVSGSAATWARHQVRHPGRRPTPTTRPRRPGPRPTRRRPQRDPPRPRRARWRRRRARRQGGHDPRGRPHHTAGGHPAVLGGALSPLWWSTCRASPSHHDGAKEDHDLATRQRNALGERRRAGERVATGRPG